MLPMQDFNHLQIDGRSLSTFLLVLEENSFSRAAERLGVNQSTVSHTINKLRDALGDPLFVRDGRGIAPTPRALALQAPATAAIVKLRELSYGRDFDPRSETMRFNIAANDLQANLLFPVVLRNASAEDIDLNLSITSSGVPKANILQEGHSDLLVTPMPPIGADIIRSKLFETTYRCFFDGSVREPPRSMEEYLAARHVTVVFDDHTSTQAAPSYLSTLNRKIVVTVPNFSSIPSFVKGTDIVATELSHAYPSIMGALDFAPVPFKEKPLTMYMVWHLRNQQDPAHKWLRERIKNVAKDLPV
ncbi:MAG: LysR family transcriptional regulator [Gammaproteobacteria bacterium]|nr:LysR family transcriptional regulator [Gammaproteobacteria bacterium]HJP37150.1 LysR family transcriptional regulator [Gammaproteobacteria bacterium]